MNYDLATQKYTLPQTGPALGPAIRTFAACLCHHTHRIQNEGKCLRDRSEYIKDQRCSDDNLLLT